MRKNKKRIDPLFLITITHLHGSDHSLTTGKIRAKNLKSALAKSWTWLVKKIDKHKCKGHSCVAEVERISPDLDIVAEEID